MTEPHIVFDLWSDSRKNENHENIVYSGQFQTGFKALAPSESTSTIQHPHADAMFFVTDGDAVIAIDNEAYEVTKGHAAIIPHEKTYTITNKSPGGWLRMVVVYSPPAHDRGTVHQINPNSSAALLQTVPTQQYQQVQGYQTVQTSPLQTTVRAPIQSTLQSPPSPTQTVNVVRTGVPVNNRVGTQVRI